MNNILTATKKTLKNTILNKALKTVWKFWLKEQTTVLLSKH